MGLGFGAVETLWITLRNVYFPHVRFGLFLRSYCLAAVGPFWFASSY